MTLQLGSELPGLGVDAQPGEKDAAALFSALDEFPFYEFANFIFRNAGCGGNDLKVTEAGINLDCCHGTVSWLHGSVASYIRRVNSR